MERKSAQNRFVTTGLILMALLGMAIIFLRTVQNGATVCDDSVSYISVARNLAAGNGYRQFEGSNTHISAPGWPPLLPFVLAIGLKGGIDPIVSIRMLDAFCFGLIIFFTGRWLYRRGVSPVFTLLAAFAILAANPLNDSATNAESEPLFCLLVLLGLSVMWTTPSGKNTNWRLTAVLTSLACLTRYMGPPLILTALILLLFSPAPNKVWRIRRMVEFVLIAATPLALWILRNSRVSGEPMGERRPSPVTLRYLFGFTVETLSHWGLPQRIQGRVVETAFLGVVLLLIALCIRFLWKREPERLRLIAPPGLFVLLYIPLLDIALARISTSIVARLYWPTYVPIVLVVFFLADAVWQTAAETRSARPVRMAVASLLGLWLAISALATVRAAFADPNNGGVINYAGTFWQQSPMIAYLRQNRPTGYIYSNAPEAYYLHVDPHIHLPPPNGLYKMPRETVALHLREFQEAVAQRPDVELVWFDSEKRPYLYTPEELAAKLNVTFQAVHRTADGVLYRVSLPRQTRTN